MEDQFSSKGPYEKVFLGFDLVNRLASGETLLSAVPVVTAINLDPDAEGMVTTATISGTTVRALVSAGLPGNTYDLRIEVLTSGGSTLAPHRRFTIV